MSETRMIHTMGINNCGGRCIIHAHVKDGVIEKITTDQSRGSIENPPLRACSRGMQYHKTYLDPETRLHSPMKRVGPRGSGQWENITWAEAVDLIAKEWIRIRDAYGPASRYVTYGWGVSGFLNPNKLGKHLLALDGGYLGDYNNYSNACLSCISEYTYGTSCTGSSMSTLLSSELIILWGHNPGDTKFDTNMYYLRLAKKKGIPIICIDPRYSETIRELKAEWIPIRPGTDAALADAMAYEIIHAGLQDQSFMDRCCQGFTKETMPAGYEGEEDYFTYVKGLHDGIPKDARWASVITGIPAEKIRELALRYAKAKPAALTQGYGPQRHINGEQNARGCMMLACLTGNVGLEGGWSGGSYAVVNPPVPKFPKASNPFPGEIPVYRWTDALDDAGALTEEEGLRGVKQLPVSIKMILNLGGNCLMNQHGDINRTRELLEDTSRCEFIVTSDLFMTASARYSDLVLPGISFLEMDNITSPWEAGNFIGFLNQAVPPMEGCRFEYDWLAEVAAKLGLYEEFTKGHAKAEEWLADCYEAHRKEWNPKLMNLLGEDAYPAYESIKDRGILRFPNWPVQVGFALNRQDPMKHPWNTPSGKIEIFSARLADKKNPGIPAIPKYIPEKTGTEPETFLKSGRIETEPETTTYSEKTLALIGYHTRRRCHSIHDSNQEMERLDPQLLHMNVQDAASRGIEDGDLVEVWNERGCLRVPVKVTDLIMPGVAAMAQGAWYTPDASGVDLRGNLNVLTSLQATPLAQGNGQHSITVKIRKAEA